MKKKMLKNKISVLLLPQTSSDGNQTTSTLSITLSRSDAGKYLSCKAYNHMSPSEALEDGWKLDIQCEYNGIFLISTFPLLHRHNFFAALLLRFAVSKSLNLCVAWVE